MAVLQVQRQVDDRRPGGMECRGSLEICTASGNVLRLGFIFFQVDEWFFVPG